MLKFGQRKSYKLVKETQNIEIYALEIHASVKYFCIVFSFVAQNESLKLVPSGHN